MGGREHAYADGRNQVSNFFKNMAALVDLKSVNHQVNGDTVVKPQYASNYDPMRRKMYVARQE